MEITDKIIVTGAAGMLGSAIVDQLRADRYQFVDGIGRQTVDLRNFESVKTYFGIAKPDHVIHCAALVYGIVGNMNNQGRAYLDNALLNTNIVEAARYAGVKKITALGTGCVYPYPSPSVPLVESAIFDGRPHNSEYGYAQAKRGMLAMLECYKESYGIDFGYVVSGNLFGPRDKFDTTNGHVVPSLVKKFYDAKQSGSNVTIWGDGSAQRDFLYVKDAARAVQMIAEGFSGPINMGSGHIWSIGEIVRTLTKISGLPADRVVWDASKPNGQEYRSYDLSRLGALGFKPQHSIAAGLKETWDWYCQNPTREKRDGLLQG